MVDMTRAQREIYFTETQGGFPPKVNLAGGATPVPDYTNTNCETITLTANSTIGAPVYPSQAVGRVVTLVLLQDSTGSRTVSFNAIYRNAPTLSAGAANTRALLEWKWDGASWQFCGGAGAFA